MNGAERVLRSAMYGRVGHGTADARTSVLGVLVTRPMTWGICGLREGAGGAEGYPILYSPINSKFFLLQ